MTPLTRYEIRRWLATLTDIAAVLATAEAIPGIPHETWRRVWRAKCDAMGIHHEITRITQEETAA